MLNRIAYIFILLLFSFASLLSGEYKSGKTVRIIDSVKTDLYVGSDYLALSAPVMGDLWAGVGNAMIENAYVENIFLAAGDISIINSKFKNAVLMGGDISFKGEITGGLKVAAGTVRISGIVGKDLIVAGGKVIIEKDAVIKGDVIAAGGEVTVFGIIEGDLRGAIGELEIYGEVKKSVDVKIGDRLIIDDEAKILGSLSYEATREFDFNSHAVFGNINFTKAIKSEFHFDKVIIAFKLFGLISALVVAIILVAFLRRQLTSFNASLDKYFLITLVIGLISIVALPILFVLLFGLIITIPLGVILLLLSGVLFFTGKIFLSIYIGSKLLYMINRKEANLFLSALLGVTILFGSFFIPYLGIVIYVIASIWGFGISCKFIQQLFSSQT